MNQITDAYISLSFSAPSTIEDISSHTNKNLNKISKEKKKEKNVKRNTNQRNLLVLTKIHNTKNKTKRNTTETKPETTPQARAPEVLTEQSQKPRKALHLIHEDLHLHQPCIGVPGRPVGYHPSKGNQGSGLTAELLRERGRRKAVNFQVRALCWNHHQGLPFSTRRCRGRFLGGGRQPLSPAWGTARKACLLGPQFQSPSTKPR